MIGGWYDMSLPSMLADYQALREGGQAARLRVGPWHHSSQDLFRYSFQDALEWFGAHLLGGPAPSWSSVRIQRIGGGGWRDLPQWPPAASTQRWHLQPQGALATPVPPAGEPSRYTYDPADPTPAVGGTSSRPANAGPKDNRELERRPDVLTYTSEPLPSALEITGPVTAELFVSSSRPHTDFFARLCDVDQKGRSVNITDGLIRLTSASPQPQPIRIDLWPNAHQFRPGHRSGSRSPAAPTPAMRGTPAAGNRWRQRQPSVQHSRLSTTTPRTPQRSSCQLCSRDSKAAMVRTRHWPPPAETDR